jgi:hypothetical protein
MRYYAIYESRPGRELDRLVERGVRGNPVEFPLGAPDRGRDVRRVNREAARRLAARLNQQWPERLYYVLRTPRKGQKT